MYAVHYSNIGPQFVSDTGRIETDNWQDACLELHKRVKEILGTIEFELVQDFGGHYVVLVGTSPVGCITIREVSG